MILHASRPPPPESSAAPAPSPHVSTAAATAAVRHERECPARSTLAYMPHAMQKRKRAPEEVRSCYFRRRNTGAARLGGVSNLASLHSPSPLRPRWLVRARCCASFSTRTSAASAATYCRHSASSRTLGAHCTHSASAHAHLTPTQALARRGGEDELAVTFRAQPLLRLGAGKHPPRAVRSLLDARGVKGRPLQNDTSRREAEADLCAQRTDAQTLRGHVRSARRCALSPSCVPGGAPSTCRRGGERGASGRRGRAAHRS